MLSYTYDVPDMPTLLLKRAPHRDLHLQHATASRDKGELALGGAWGDAPMGGMLLFRGVEREAVERFALMDPYVIHGLVKAWSVRPWTVVVDGLSR